MSDARWLVLTNNTPVEPSPRWKAIHTQMMVRKGITGAGATKAYTEVRFHPTNANLEAFTILPEDVSIAQEILNPSEFLALKTYAQMEADGWFPITPLHAQEVMMQAAPTPMAFVRRHKWKVAAGAAAAAAAMGAAAYLFS
jgi:hypothetical protein